jgi:ATP-dependent protease HslVU (ClpYQ) peptidase subunit
MLWALIVVGTMAALALIGVGVVLALLLAKRLRPPAPQVVAAPVASSAATDLRALVPRPAAVAPPALPAPVPKQIFYKNEQGQDLVGIQALSPERFDKAKKTKIDLQSSHFELLNPLLQSAPGLLSVGTKGSGRYMEVIVNGKLAAKGNTGLFMPFVRGSDGKIMQMAQLREAAGLRALAIGSAAFAVLSYVVAQANMVEIKRQLRAISEKLESIHNFQQNDRAATIKSSLEYLRDQIFPSVSAGEISQAVRHQLESIDMNLAKILDHLFVDVGSHLTQAQQMQTSFKGTGSSAFEEMKQHAQKIQSLTEQWLFCAQARAMAWQILMFFPGETQLKASRRQAIVQSITNMIELGKGTAIEQAVANFQGIKAWMAGEDTIRKARKAMIEPLRVSQQQIADQAPPIAGNINVFNAKMLELEQPIGLAVRVENGQVVEAYRLQ